MAGPGARPAPPPPLSGWWRLPRARGGSAGGAGRGGRFPGSGWRLYSSRRLSRSRSQGGRIVRAPAEYNEAVSGSGVSACGAGRAVEGAPVEKAGVGSGPSPRGSRVPQGPEAVGAAGRRGRAPPPPTRAPPCCHRPGLDADAHSRRPPPGGPFLPAGRCGAVRTDRGQTCSPSSPLSLQSAGRRFGRGLGDRSASQLGKQLVR